MYTDFVPAKPKPIVASPGLPTPQVPGGEPAPYIIMVGDDNLLTIIADLTDRIIELETA